jgi:DNA-binding NtrC family response regulator
MFTRKPGVPADAAPSSPVVSSACPCCVGEDKTTDVEPLLHEDVQDTTCEGWRLLLELIEKAASEHWTTFAPGRLIPSHLWRDVVELPTSIGTLKDVKQLVLYGSHLVRIPREIGDMSGLVEFIPYTSRRLHWFPYEITRCAKLVKSTVSTRRLYGNFKYRLHFPKLEDGGSPRVTARDQTSVRCSVCDRLVAISKVKRVWTSQRIATDVLPLLVHACSDDCISRLPPGADRHLRDPHRGGREVRQPDFLSEFERWVKTGVASRITRKELFRLELSADVLPEPVVASDALRAAYDRAAELARSSDNLLIWGEPGVGKTTLARWIHAQSVRARGPLVSLDCGLQSSSIEAALVGRVSPASKKSRGLLQAASGGTVLLRHFDLLTPFAQARLLRVLASGRARPLGGLRRYAVDCRFIVTTTLEPEGALERYFIRPDLLARLGLTSVRIPPLRDRPDDIDALARHVVSCNFYPARKLSTEAMAFLCAKAWGGNVPHLRDFIMEAAGGYSAAEIPLAHFRVKGPRADERHPSFDPSAFTPEELEERALILRTLEEKSWNQTRAASALAMPRRTLVSKLDRYRLPRPAKPPAPWE